jgi:hypothetical protein
MTKIVDYLRKYAIDAQELYPYFAATTFSGEVNARGLAALFHFLGLRQVVIVYEDDALGRGFQKAFIRYAQELGITTESLPLSVSESNDGKLAMETRMAAVEFLRTTELKVVVAETTSAELVRFMNLGIEAGLSVESFSWFMGSQSTAVCSIALHECARAPVLVHHNVCCFALIYVTRLHLQRMPLSL